MTPFVIKEEYGSLVDIVRQSFAYIYTSKQRLLKVVIYSIYLYLFFKRFAFSLKYFRTLVKKSLSTCLFKMSVGDSAIGLHRRLAGLTRFQGTSKLAVLRRSFHRLVKLTAFLYNAFILVQLCCIGYAESFRIKSMCATMLNSVKKIRIKDRRSPAQSEVAPSSSEVHSSSSSAFTLHESDEF